MPAKTSVSDTVNRPLGILRFLYLGSSDVQKDLDYYTKVLGGKKIWDYSNFGTRVAAVEACTGPQLILAGHRPAPSVLPIFQVENLKAKARELGKNGWQPTSAEFEIPNGPCYLFKDPSGNQIAIFQDMRPGLLETGFRKEI